MSRGSFWKSLRIGGLLMILVAALAALETWRLGRAEEAMLADWRRLLGERSFPEAFPATENNQATWQLANRLRLLGISRPPGVEVEAPSKEAEERYAEASDELGRFLRDLEGFTSRRHWPAAPAGQYLDQAEGVLVGLHDDLRAGILPIWKRDISSLSPVTEVPDLLGLFQLQKVLVAVAAREIQSGEDAEADRYLEVAWRLSEQLRAEPSVIAQLIDQAALRWQLALLRGMCRPSPAWESRLANVDLRQSARIAMEFQAFYLYSSSRWDGPVEVIWAPAKPPWRAKRRSWLRPLVRWGIRDYAVRYHRFLTTLEDEEPRAFDPDVFCRRQLAAIPRWQLVGRLADSCMKQVFGQALQRGLAVELTEKVIAERRSPPSQEGPRESRAVPGVYWLREVAPGSATFRLDRELYRGPADPPLTFTVAAAECTSPS